MVFFASLICVVIAQGPTTPLSGTVIGPNGEPVAGAEVVLAGMPMYDPPILARGRSDASGRFRLDRPAGLAGQDRYIAPILWVVKPGFRLAYTKFPGPMPGAGEPVRIVLEPPGKAEVRVEGPNGEPVAGARVRVEWFGRVSTNVPDQVVDLIEAIADKDGLAVIAAAANDEVAYIDVHSQAYGIQGRPFYPTSTKPKRVWLRPVGSLEGRLVAADPKVVKGWRVRAYARSGDPTSREPVTTGYATGTTDDAGRFVFPAIASGALQLDLKPPGDLPVLAVFPNSLAIVEGRENSVVIPLRAAATVAGVVRERGTGAPVPGVKLWMVPSGGGRSENTVTDAQGRYTIRTLERKAKVLVTDAPPSHVRSGNPEQKEFAIPEGPGRIEVDPIEIFRAAPPLRFVVRDEAGRPVPKATVLVQSSARQDQLVTDDRGETVLTGIAPGDSVTIIEGHRHERMIDQPVTAVAGGTEPVVITVVPGLTVAMAGRVLGPGGTPIAGAKVKVQFRKAATNTWRGASLPVRLDDGVELRSGPDGRFQTANELDRRGHEYGFEASADGFLAKQSDWVTPDGGDRITVPDLTLRRSQTLRFVSGRVVDREGKGVAGSSVFQSGDAPRGTSTTADADGRFRLAGVPGREALIFAEKAGFRFGGAIAKPDDARVDIRLARLTEPPRSMPKSLPSPLTRAEERALAKELLAPRPDAARPGAHGPTADSVLPTPAWLDPDRVLEMLENRVLTDPAQALRQLALAQLESDPAAAVATIESDLNPGSRAEGFLAIAQATPESDRARRIEWINRALAEARRVDNKEIKLQLLGHIADCWLDLDAVDRATPIIREGQAIAALMPQDRYSYRVEEFADMLAVVDLAAARSIFERKGRTNAGPTDPATLNRHLGEAAVRLAAIKPAEAERLVPGVVPNFWDGSREEFVLRICRRMARADLPRARKILDTIDDPTGPASYPKPALVPYGLSLLAFELVSTDPAQARRLLDEAFVRLRKVSDEQGGKATDPPVSCVMAGLLPMVERLEPDRLEERLWLAAACRASLVELPDMNAVQVRVSLAMLVSRFDRAMAAVIIAPALERLPELLADSGNYYRNAPTIKALAAYDPRAVVALIRNLPDSARRPPDNNLSPNALNIDAEIRLETVNLLGLPIEKRRQKASGWDVQPRSIRRVY